MEGTYTGNKKVSANKESSTRNINISGIISLNGWNKDAAAAKLLPSCPTLCDPIDSSPPGSSVPWILQARMLEWVAISFSNACMHTCMLSSFQLCATLWTEAHQAILSTGFSRQEYCSGLPFPSSNNWYKFQYLRITNYQWQNAIFSFAL